MTVTMAVQIPEGCCPATREVLLAMAEQLEVAREKLEGLADTLCCDPDVVDRYLSALQTLDHVGQQQAAIATIIRAQDIPAAAHANTLEVIRRRMAPLKRTG